MRKAWLASFLCMALVAVSLTVGCGPKSEPKLGANFYPGQITAMMPNYSYTPCVFTATSQNCITAISPANSIFFQLTATALTTVTWAATVSFDGGVTYIALPVAPYTYSAGNLAAISTAAVTSTTAPLGYIANVSGATHIKITTSSTFTATNVTFTPQTSSYRGIL